MYLIFLRILQMKKLQIMIIEVRIVIIIILFIYYCNEEIKILAIGKLAIFFFDNNLYLVHQKWIKADQ